ncbi:hypothetical protein Pla175_35170 [Pirellulimonas nuda]|uniref:Right handed beta helix domain-containing protein n=1 Tax=Pirellulimonas nuda TaxID=2528009 RepID=A0A518DF64_9BACT|nr:right-handed parallel beta-helix repeat-containing protein [Pirellulimonas nuda]QDU90117.1 hypothetical protein Pla175_35170 [Pirellulimonas nuda]
MKRKTLAALLVTAALAGACEAREIFVNNVAGADNLDGLSDRASGRAGPVRTISRALCLALPGDHVLLTDTGVPYREQVSIAGPRLHGSERRPLVLDGRGAVLDGTVEAAPGAWRPAVGNVFALALRRLSTQQLFSAGEPLKRVSLTRSADAPLALEPLEWSLVDRRLLVKLEQDRLPESYDLRHAGLETGVTLYNTHHVIVRNLVVQGFHLDGLNAHELVRDCLVDNIDSRANGRSGLSVGGVSRVEAIASNFYDNGRVQVRVEGQAELALESCEVAASEGAAKFKTAGGELKVNGQAVVAP